MKKKKFKIFIIVIIIISIFLLNFILNSHNNINYQIKNNGIIFNINEKHLKNESLYSYIVNIDGYNDINFYFEIETKKNKFITDIKYFNEDNIRCIYPILEDNQDKAYLSCMEKDNLTSYYNIKGKSEKLFKFLEKLKSDGYNNIVWNEIKEESIKYEKILYIPSNIEKDETLIIWNYKGIYLLNKEKNKTINILNNDKYNNNLGVLLDKYYVFPNYDDKYNYKIFYFIDVLTGNKKQLKSELEISSSIYILGIVDNYLYFFDKDNYRQLKINRKAITEVGNKDIGGKYYNGEWIDKSIYDFNKNLSFKVDLDMDNIIYPYNENMGYYYKLEVSGNNTTILRGLIENKKEIKLFSFKNIKDIKFRKNNIYFISGKSLYKYNDLSGIKKIIENSEFEFNDNLYDIYIK